MLYNVPLKCLEINRLSNGSGHDVRPFTFGSTEARKHSREATTAPRIKCSTAQSYEMRLDVRRFEAMVVGKTLPALLGFDDVQLPRLPRLKLTS